MLFKSFLTVSTLTTLALATDCLQCCQKTSQGGDPLLQSLLTLLGIVLTNPNVLVGINCSPINPIVAGATGACAPGTTVICNDNTHVPAIAIDCFPVTI
ncbi:hypothetical protein E1B28_013181 [Marasmius oreades]|uniref:Hydrophobin n=1 Tax=Marasmius oreades TaxID=181124 RepID=A0A9P7UMR3_9AGAR|nr:uncharacterized protein E1B28_013181 [Marasmius oreades]KAG7087200.1 hypothetical protein E1B28_013181 [Marasmius oreades]